MNQVVSSALPSEAYHWFGAGLGGAFAATWLTLLIFMLRSREEEHIDHGFLGLMLLLVTIFYLIAFSFLVAASSSGLDIKILVVTVDAMVLIGTRLLGPPFLRYLSDQKQEMHQGDEQSRVAGGS
jgi:hypothetical protein